MKTSATDAARSGQGGLGGWAEQGPECELRAVGRPGPGVPSLWVEGELIRTPGPSALHVSL